MRMVRLSCVLVLLLMSALTCPGAEGPAPESLKTPFRLGIVLSVGGLGDRSFNDASYLGIQKLRQIPGILVDLVEPSDVTAIEPGLEYLAARNCDLIAGVGLFANEAIRRVAGKNPDKSFLLLDSVVTEPNVLSILFNEEEGSFFAGALAGLLTNDGKVGFLGGMQSPVIAAFERGFRNGVAFVNSSASIRASYAGTDPEAFNSPEKGFRAGQEMVAEGVDIVYHAAGRTGLGLIDAARRARLLVIGVDSDQSTVAPGKVVASVVKRLDVALDRAVRMAREGRFRGGILTLGLADAGIDLQLSRFNREVITPLVRDRLHDVESFLLHRTKEVVPESGH